MSTKPDSGPRSGSADAVPTSRSADAGGGADRHRGGEALDHAQVSPERALNHAASETRESGGPRQSRLEETRFDHAIADGSDRSRPAGVASGKSLGGQLSDALNHAAASGKDLAHKAGDALRGVSDRATDSADKIGDSAVKFGKAVAVTGAVGYHVFEPAVGLAARSPDYGPARNDATSAQRIDIETPADGVAAFSAHVSENKERMGISDDTEPLATWEEKRQEERITALGDDHGEPESSLQGDLPDGHVISR